LDYKNYKKKEIQLKTIYILNKIAEEFVIKFYKEITQRYNRTIMLIIKLKQKYIVRNIWKIARKVIKEYPNC